MTLSVVKENDISEEIVKAISGYTETVYLAVEITGSEALKSIICYRTKDSVTHQAELRDGELVVRVSVPKF